MKIQCPKCKQAVPADQVNMVTDLAFCPLCHDAFKVSEHMEQEAFSPDTLQNPPQGAWFRTEMDRVVVGATTRSPTAFFLVPFMCVWSGGALGGIYGSQIVRGEFNPLLSLFGIPFLLGSIVFWGYALMTIGGKVEVSIGRCSSVFVGIGKMGRTRKFVWSEVRSIREDRTDSSYPGGHEGALLLEGRERLKFGSGLNDNRRYFVLNVLKYLKSQSR